MDSLNIVTCGSSLKVWSLPDTVQVYEGANVKKVTSATWNYDGSCLASCGVDKPDHITLTHTKNDKFSSVDIIGPHGRNGQITALQYPRTTSKFLCIASQDHVLLYDINKKKSRQDFNRVPSVTCLSMNHNDKYIAAGNSTGQLYLLNSLTGRPSFTQPIQITDEDSALTAAAFNNIKYSMVGASCDDGSVGFWDVNTGKELQTFREHKAPATGLAFSPVNEVLVLSAGLDKRCVCYDTSLKRPFTSITLDAPVTSVDFASDGSNLILGSSQGKVYLYDLRCFTAPTTVIDAHDGPVSSVLFRTGANRENVSSLLATLSKTASLSSVNSSKGSWMMKENVEPSLQPTTSRNSSFGSEGFSPIQKIGSEKNFAHAVPSRLSTDSIFSPLRDLSGAAITSKHISNDSLFSPLRENFDSNNASSDLSPLTSGLATKKFSVTPLLSSITEEASLVTKETKENDYGDQTPTKEEDNLESVVLSGSVPFYLPQKTKSQLIREDDTFEDVSDGSKAHSTTGDEARALLTAFPQILSSTDEKLVPLSNEVSVPPKNCENNAFQTFKQEFVQAAVEEAMDEFCSDMRKQLWHMHYDMIKAFQQQQMELKQNLKEYAVNEALVKEVEQLRAENAELKKTPFVMSSQTN